MRIFPALFLLLISSVGVASAQKNPPPREFNIGYFEPGEYAFNSLMREAIRSELDKLVPAGMKVTFVPSGFRSAAWHRDSSRIMAQQLQAAKELDLVVAAGPWSVQDLLAAGFTKPIVAYNQLEPDAGGLLGSDGRPVASNLTVQHVSGRLPQDLVVMRSLVRLRKLGVLAFTDPGEKNHLIDSLKILAGRDSIEVVTAEAHNNWGTYAYFKSYQQLDRKIDALYIGPLWGLDASATAEFLTMVSRDHIPLFVGSDRTLVSQGAFASADGTTLTEAARFCAEKIIRILKGAKPADLPIALPGAATLTINEAAMNECKITLPDRTLAGAYIVPAPPDPSVTHFSLGDAIAQALDQNPGYLAKYQALDSASAAAKGVLSVLQPQVNAYGQAGHVDQNSVYNNFGEISPDAYSAGLTLDANLFSLPAIRSVQISARKKNATQLNVEAAALDMASGVTAAYLNYLKASELEGLASLRRSLIDELLGIARSRVAFGEADTVETLQWEQEQIRATGELIIAQNNVKVARVLLNVLINRPGDEPLTLDPEWYSSQALMADWRRLSFLVPNAERTSVVQNYLTREAIASNPDVRAADVNIETQKLQLSRNWARYFPTLGFHAGYNLIDSLADRPPTFEARHHTWGLSAYLRFPLFESGDRRRERSLLKAELNGLEYKRDDARLQIMGKVQAAVYELKSSGMATEVATQLCDISTSTLNRSRDKYDIGAQSFTEAATALDKHVSSRESELALRYSYFSRQAALLRAIGWAPKELTTTPGALLYSRLSAEYGSARK